MKKKDKEKIKTENSALKISLYGAIFFLVVESIMSFYTGSQSILMDAVYGGADFIMILISIKILPLLYRPMSEKHPFGFSQVESIFITIKGAMLFAVTAGLVMNNIQIIVTGGKNVEFSMVAIFEIFAVFVILIILLLLKRANKKLNSPLVKAEIDGWIIDLLASIGLAIAFILPEVINNNWMEKFAPYLDQSVAILLAVLILPVPIKMLSKGLRDVFLLAPETHTIDQVKNISTNILGKYDFDNAQYDIIKTGRKIWISIYFKSNTDTIFVSEIVKAHKELENELLKEFDHLYVELIPEFENIT